MKTLVKLLVPFAVAATLFVGCGGDNGPTCKTTCTDTQVCVTTTAAAGSTEAVTECKTKPGEDGKCGTDQAMESKDSPAIKYCA